jgi:hypothetical protein
MQFKIPQNVQMEDKIVGPLTLKHMIILGAGGGLAYFVYIILSRAYFWEIWLPPVAIIVILTIVIAFVKVYNLSFGKFILLFIEYNLLPRKRKWMKSSGEVFLKKPIEIKTDKKKKPVKDKSKESLESIEKLDKISKKLDEYSDKFESIKKQQK